MVRIQIEAEFPKLIGNRGFQMEFGAEFPNFFRWKSRKIQIGGNPQDSQWIFELERIREPSLSSFPRRKKDGDSFVRKR